MADLNEVRLIGRLTRDPELRSTAGGQQICSFGLATSHKYKGQDGAAKEDTTFVDLTSWGKLAEVCSKYLHKGSSVFVGGRLKFDSWEDKQSGQKRSRLTVTAENIQFLDGGKGKDERESGTCEDKNNWKEKDANMPGNYGRYERPPAPVTAGMGELPQKEDFEEWVNEKNYGEPPF